MPTKGFARIARDINQLRAEPVSPGHPPDTKNMVCMRLADAQLKELLKLRGAASKGVNYVTKYLSESGYPIRPAFGTELTLNIVFHVFILFLALTLLYIIVVAPLENQSLTNQVEDEIHSGLSTGLRNLETKCSAGNPNCVRDVLRKLAPSLQKVRNLYAGEDPTRKAHNQSVLNFAWAVVAALGLAFVVSVMILAFGSGVSMGKPVATIIFENLIIFAIIGIAEFTFFKLVAAKFIPVQPSTVSKEAISTLKNSF